MHRSLPSVQTGLVSPGPAPPNPFSLTVVDKAEVTEQSSLLLLLHFEGNGGPQAVKDKTTAAFLPAAPPPYTTPSTERQASL